MLHFEVEPAYNQKMDVVPACHIQKKQKTILFSIYEVSFIRRTIALADCMRQEGWHTIIYHPVYFPLPENYEQNLSTKGHTFLARYTESGGYTEDFIKMNTVLTPKKMRLFFLKKMLTSFSLLFWLAVYFLADKKHRELLQTLKSRQEELWTYESLCKLLRPNIVAVSEFNVERDSSYFALLRKKYNFEVVAVYGGAVSGPQEILRAYEQNPDFQIRSWHQKLFGLLNKEWIVPAKPYSISRLPVTEAICRKILCISPPLPCVVNSGAPWILCSCEYIKNLFIQQGIPADSILPVGSFELDDLFYHSMQGEKSRKDKEQDYDSAPSKWTVLVGLPSNLERLSGLEFSSYEKILDCMLGPLLANPSFHVIASPHPSLEKDKIDYARALGCTVIEKPAAMLLGEADLFVAVVSSTIFLALAAGVPVVNFDVYKFRYTMYDFAKACLTVNTAHEYSQAIDKLGKEDEFVALKKTAIAEKNIFGNCDGKSKENIVRLLSEFANE